MRLFSFLIITILPLVSCCHKEDLERERKNPAGEVFFLPYNWKVPIHKSEPKSFMGSIRGNLVFGNTILITTTDGPQKDNLTLLNVDAGDELWSWSEFYQPGTELPYFSHIGSYHNVLHWITGSRHYAINIETGKTLWKDRKEVSYPGFVAMRDDTVILTGPTLDTLPNTTSVSAYKRSIYDPNCHQFLHPYFRFDTMGIGNLMTSIFQVYPLTGELKDKLLVITSQPYDNWYYAPEINLFDTKSNSWIYHSKEMVTPKQNNAGNTGVIFEDKFYFSAGREIMCHEILTGRRLWKNQYPADFLFSGFEISDGILIANCENQVLYGINLESGNTIWQGRGSGTSCPLKGRILNGVLYYTGGAPNDVFAIDIYSGETLWALEAEEYEPSGHWKGDTYVVPGQNGQKGKVVACTYMHCYCFDAVR